MPKRALICDDDRLFLLWLTRLLREWGWTVDSVTTISEASILLKQSKFDLLVLDLFVDDRTACDLIPEVRAQLNAQVMSLVLVTAATPTQVRETVHDACEATVLSKPIDIARLRSIVNSIVEANHREQERAHSYLIIDHGGIQARVLGRMIQEQGGFVIYAPDVEQAKVLIRNVRPDALLLESDGSAHEAEDLASFGRTKSLTLPPMIVLSTVINQDLVERFLRAGVVDILLKPISVFRLQEALKRANGAESRAETYVTHSRRTLMIVEDFTITAKMLERLFVQEGFQVYVMRSGEMAFEMIKRVRPDMMLLDLNLPGISGVDLLQELNRSGLAVPTVVVTGDRDSRRLQELRKLGVMKVVNKPIIPDELTTYVAGYFSEGGTHDQVSEYDVLLALADEAAGVVISAALESDGIQSKVVTDGYQAVHELQGKPRAAVVDIVIAGLDGTEVLRRTRQMNRDAGTRILALAEEMDNEIAEELSQLGADDTLGKPYALTALLTKIRNLLEHSAPGLSIAEFAADVMPEIRRILNLSDQELCRAAKRLGHNLCGTAPLVALPLLTTLGRALEDAGMIGDRKTCEDILTEIRSEIEKAPHAQHRSADS